MPDIGLMQKPAREQDRMRTILSKVTNATNVYITETNQHTLSGL